MTRLDGETVDVAPVTVGKPLPRKWVVATMDAGVIARTATKRAAYEWVERKEGAPILRRQRFGPGDYAVVCGYPGESDGPPLTNYFVMTLDVVERHQFAGACPEVPNE